MASLINQNRPPVFCPGCSHDRVVRALDNAFQNMGLRGDQVVMISDIGCSGLIDTFFNTHALHGLHGRALTYAAGIKLAHPDLNVVVTMGDGGLGIGGAHFLEACRRNLNLTLLILNNFNFGMTGGQFSATTPTGALVGSGFLNRLEKPMDACSVAVAAGAPFVVRCSAYQKDLASIIEEAICFEGFSVIDIHGICTGRYLRRNKVTPEMIKETLDKMEKLAGPVFGNRRPEYGSEYRKQAQSQKPASLPREIERLFDPPKSRREEVVILGAAGQRIVTAGEILAMAGLHAGLRVTQKNEYNITVLRGPSITEVILSPEEIDYTGIMVPTAVIALASEGIERRKNLFGQLDEDVLVVRAVGTKIPPSKARVVDVDFRAWKIKKADWALASLAFLASVDQIVNRDMLESALRVRFKGEALNGAIAVVEKVFEQTDILGIGRR
ncbi:MAG TPA: 2-oxoglutarate synthase [Deltaproteobacteria bacterium]|nr:2-oxoglutarate synthase [Deltaproteobacteria bacterium]